MIKIFTILPLTIEELKEGFRGQITINDDLLVDIAETVDVLKERMKSMIYAFEGINVDDFEIIRIETGK